MTGPPLRRVRCRPWPFSTGRRTYPRRRTLFALGLAWCAAGTALADGFQFPGIGSEALGRGGAVVADSKDWTSVYWNPSGLARYGGKDWEFGAEGVVSFYTSRDDNSIAVSPLFQAPPSSAPGQFTRTEVTGTAFLGALGGAIRLGDATVLGLGAYTPLLNGMDFRDSLNQGPLELEGVFDSTFYTIVFDGSVGHRLGDDWAIGAGMNVIYSSLSLTSVQGRGGSGSPPVEQLMDLSGNGTGVEWVAGVTYSARENLRVGAVYRSGAGWDIEGRSQVRLTGLLDSEGPFVFPFRHPATFAIGLAWDVQPSWTLTFDWQRTAWSSFKNGIEFEDPLVPAIPDSADWQDSNRFRVGVLYRLSAHSSLAGGYYYAGRAVDQPDFTSVTDGDLNHLTFNFAHRWRRVRLDIGVLTGGGAATVSGNETYTGGTQLNFGVRFGR